MLESPFLSRLKLKRVRLTGPRRAVLGALEKEHAPLSAKDVWNLCRGSKSDLVSIYRILDRFEKEHIVVRIELGDGITRYELARAKHHHHARCESCGMIQDIALCIDGIDQKVKDQFGFELRFHEIQMSGLCAACAKSRPI
jgi:Fur family ferric uptake transcriptional regulator